MIMINKIKHNKKILLIAFLVAIIVCLIASMIATNAFGVTATNAGADKKAYNPGTTMNILFKYGGTTVKSGTVVFKQTGTIHTGTSGYNNFKAPAKSFAKYSGTANVSSSSKPAKSWDITSKITHALPAGYVTSGTGSGDHYDDETLSFVSSSTSGNTATVTFKGRSSMYGLTTCSKGSSSDEVRLSKANLTVNLKYRTYTVTFNPNGGSGSMASQSFTYKTSKTLTANAFTRTGYTFNGWNTKADGTGTNYANKANMQNVATTGNLTLYAKWKAVNNLTVNNKTVTFNPNGGEMIGNSEVDRTVGSTVNYEEKGMRLSPSNTSLYPKLGNAPSGFNNVYTLVAKVKREGGYYLTNNIEAGGVELGMNDSNVYHTRYMPAQSQYLGPSTSAPSNPDVWIVGTSDGSNMKLYIDGQPVGTSFGCTQAYVASNAPFVFGYNPGANGVVQGSASDQFTGLLYKAAVYKRALSDSEISAMYNNNALAENAALSFDAEVGTPYRKGYTFLGWYTEEEGGTRITNNTVVNGDVTYYAHWEPTEYTVKFNGNGGDGDMEEGTISLNSPLVIPANEYTNTGYKFKEWNLDPYGEGAIFGDGSTITLDDIPEDIITAAEANGNTIELYAQWIDMQKVIHFEANGGTGKMEDQNVVAENNETINPNQFVRENYLFKGWAQSRRGDGTVIRDEGEVDAIGWTEEKDEVTLYAIWVPGTFIMDPSQATESDIIEITPDQNGNAQLNTRLRDGQSFLLFGIDKGSLYDITEAGSKGYLPSYDTYKGKKFVDTPKKDGEYEQNLSTDVETTLGDVGIKYTNKEVPPPGMGLSFRKALKGDLLTDADKEKEFTFRYIVTGLDPEYKYLFEGPDGVEQKLTPSVDSSVTPANQSGYLSGTVQMKGGDAASFKNLPAGAKYNITEVTKLTPSDTFDYTARYDVVNGTAVSMSSVNQTTLPDGTNSSTGLTTGVGSGETVNGYPAETITEDNDVSYVFTNTKGNPHNLTLRKATTKDGATDSTNTETFTFHVFFTSLQSNHTYTASSTGSAFTTDANGKAEVVVNLRNGQSVTWYSLDSSCNYDVVEQNCNYKAKAEISSTATGDTLCEVQGSYGTGVDINNGMEPESITVDHTGYYESTAPNNTDASEPEVNTLELTCSPKDSSTITVTSFNEADAGGGDESVLTFTAGVPETQTDENPHCKITYDGDRTFTREADYYNGWKVSYTYEEDQTPSEVGFNENQTVAVTNDKPTKRDLVLSKSVIGTGAGDTTSFTFPITFESLDASTTYQYIKTDANGTETNGSFTTNSLGYYTNNFSLKDGEKLLFKGLKLGSYYKITESGKSGYIPAYTYNAGLVDDIYEEENEDDVEGSTVTGSSGQSLATPKTELILDTDISYTNTKEIKKPIKKVSDTDGKTLTGDGVETLVNDNFVPDMEKKWTYTITQTIDPGYSTFRLYDLTPDNIKLLPSTIKLTYSCSNGTTYGPSLTRIEDEYGDVYYQNSTFRVDTDGYMVMVSTREEGESVVRLGGQIKLEFDAMVDDDVTKDDFRKSGQITPDQRYIKVKNFAETSLDGHDYTTNTVTTTIPSSEGEAGLSVHKNVTGNLGDLTKNFKFTASFKDLKPSTNYYYGSPKYILIEQTYENGRVTISASRNDSPVENVRIRIYSLEDDELVKDRTTGESGQVSFPLEEDTYRYIVSYGSDEVETYLPIVENQEIDPISIVQKLDMKHFTSDSSGNATVEFYLKDDEGTTFIELPDDTKYTVSEAASDHVAAFAFTNGANSATLSSKANTRQWLSLSTNEETLDMEVCENPAIVFTNNRSLAPPMGIFSSGLLIAFLTLILAQGYLVVRIRKKVNTPESMLANTVE